MSASRARLTRIADHAWRVEWGGASSPDAAINRQVHAFAARLRARAPAWLHDAVPGYASLGVFFDPARASAGDVAGTLEALLAEGCDAGSGDDAESPGATHEIAVAYGGEAGPDLEDAARALGLTPEALVARHAGAQYTVAMVGFAPGFPYLLGLDPALALPRRATPRTRVAAGSVAIGGAQTGIYPRESPGGWHVIGRTAEVLFDPAREPPALLAPGDRVQFRPASALAAPPAPPRAAVVSGDGLAIEVIEPGALTAVQDAGRPGWRHLGVGTAGALDPHALAAANLLVGNAPHAAGLEITLRGPKLRLQRAARIALVGAAVPMTFIGGHDGRPVRLPAGRPVDLPPGIVHVGTIRAGLRAWLAFAGGIEVAPVLGSRSTDLRGGFGGLAGRALQAGDALPLGEAAIAPLEAPQFPGWWVESDAAVAPDAPVRYVPSALPQARALAQQRWCMDPRSDRQGLRLAGQPLPAVHGPEPLSAAVAPGMLQLPADGQPIVLLADAQTTGGYPTLGHVIAADLPRLAQRRPGDAVAFAPVTQAEADALWHAREAASARQALAIAARTG